MYRNAIRISVHLYSHVHAPPLAYLERLACRALHALFERSTRDRPAVVEGGGEGGADQLHFYIFGFLQNALPLKQTRPKASGRGKNFSFCPGAATVV